MSYPEDLRYGRSETLQPTYHGKLNYNKATKTGAYTHCDSLFFVFGFLGTISGTF